LSARKSSRRNSAARRALRKLLGDRARAGDGLGRHPRRVLRAQAGSLAELLLLRHPRKTHAALHTQRLDEAIVGALVVTVLCEGTY